MAIATVHRVTDPHPVARRVGRIVRQEGIGPTARIARNARVRHRQQVASRERIVHAATMKGVAAVAVASVMVATGVLRMAKTAVRVKAVRTVPAAKVTVVDPARIVRTEVRARIVPVANPARNMDQKVLPKNREVFRISRNPSALNAPLLCQGAMTRKSLSGQSN